jgi:carbonic anhydrase
MAVTTPPPQHTDGTPAAALARLLAGNQRYVEASPTNVGRDAQRRLENAHGQSPFAVVLGCSDSRVPVEVVFDVGIGELFVVRVAGNTAETPIVQGSIEYAVSATGAALVMVLGHEGCGAVQAALSTLGGSSDPLGQIGAFVAPILPAAERAQDAPVDQRANAAVVHNVVDQVSRLRTLSPTLAPAVAEGTVAVVGAQYLLTTGEVRLIPG